MLGAPVVARRNAYREKGKAAAIAIRRAGDAIARLEPSVIAAGQEGRNLDAGRRAAERRDLLRRHRTRRALIRERGKKHQPLPS